MTDTQQTEETKPVYFPIYRISHDDGTGHYRSTFDFVRYEWATKAHRGGPDGQFVVGYSHDEGIVGTLRAPAGSRLVECEGGDTCVETPDGFTYTAAEALASARSANDRRDTGLSLVRQRPKD